ncbi:S-layer family protein [Calothrix sp. FACHB-1219]|uniref:two-partner secretion domain-containing protein n=1 Tax=unclassified Calothrix TaxID=2619626 RepID=UPI001689B708|nr:MULTISPECIES: S-layer family protein [unclassified Calothrix]MBD2202488.1 S-layer family protein [Calothrix sp. FACHB-168]MBD2217921.1 S-layer family protein [Calothrix sp. FACHB-1219]
MRAIKFLAAFTTGLLTAGMVLPAMSQVISDGTTNTVVKSDNNNFTIINGIEKGNNLFHSFSNFSVPSAGSATFDLVNTPNITNIFSRVTGGNISEINGLISTINSNNSVNLFLMNPAGIVFGKDAVLNISGSFIGTTANSIKFSDSSEFSAINPTTSALLTISVPIGLQMGSSAAIEMQGKGNDGIVPTNNLGIVASPGKTIALVGGDIKFTGGVITAPFGRIEIGAVTSGTVNLIPSPMGWQLGYSQVTDFGNIQFTERSSLWNPYPVGNPFGGIQVVGRDIRLDQSQIAAATAGTGHGSNITVNAERSLSLGGVNPNAFAPSAWIVNQVAQGATGNGGGVNIQAGDITLQDGAAIETLSLGAGSAGKVQVIADTITASGTVAVTSPLLLFSNSNSRIASETYASGDGGNVSAIARKLILADGAAVETAVFPGATGKGGDISVQVADEIYVTGLAPFHQSGIAAYTYGIRNSGNISVSSGTFNLIDGGLIITFTSRLPGLAGTGIGNAGDMEVVARKSINLVGTSPISPIQSSLIGSVTTGSGTTGNLSITTPILSMQDGASLGATALPMLGSMGDPNQGNNLGNNGNITLNISDRLIVSGINPFTGDSTLLGSFTGGNSNTGDVTIQTNQLLVLDGGLIGNTTFGVGNAGTLTIQAHDILIDSKNNLAGGIVANARIMNESQRQLYGLPNSPTGNTGVLNIDTDRLTLRNRGIISVTHQGIGNAGELNIQANQISLNAGEISATTASGKGGNINLAVKNTLLSRHGSKINAEAGGIGNGGNINISSPVIVAAENSDIIANAVNGNGGNINITTQGIFGLKYSPQLTNESDITASSQFGINGTVDINNFGIDPNSGLVQLPANITDSSQQIATGCSQTNTSSFVATGRGGIPENPMQEVRSDRTWADIRNISAYRKTAEVITQIPTSPAVLIQATSWHRNAQGKIELVAAKSSTQMQQPLTCAAIPKN